MAEPQNETNTNSQTVNMPPAEQKVENVQPTPNIEPPNNKRSKALWWFTFTLIFLGLAWFLYWFFYLQFEEYTDDAYVNGNMININSAVQGSVVAFYADDTDLVIEGQLLVLLDTTPYQVAFERQLSELASTVLQVRQFFDNVKANEAIVENSKIAFSRAKYDYDNRSKLVGSKAISNEDFTHSRDALNSAESSLKQAEAQLKAAQSAAGNTSIEEHPLIAAQKSAVIDAYYNLERCKIFAPKTGFVAQRAVEVGSWATPMTNLMAVIPKDYVWVDANFKETQLTYMRIGQPASVWFDIYGSKVEYKGKVLGIASGTGSIFSIIPPQNATGNWIKIVQRLPVRISLDPETLEKFPPRLGLSAEVRVDITNSDLPMLAQNPPSKPVGETFVFDLNLEKVEKLIEDVIQENLAIETQEDYE